MEFSVFADFSKIRFNMMLSYVMYNTIVSCSYLFYDTESRPFLIWTSSVYLFIIYDHTPAEGFQQKLVAREL